MLCSCFNIFGVISGSMLYVSLYEILSWGPEHGQYQDVHHFISCCPSMIRAGSSLWAQGTVMRTWKMKAWASSICNLGLSRFVAPGVNSKTCICLTRLEQIKTSSQNDKLYIVGKSWKIKIALIHLNTNPGRSMKKLSNTGGVVSAATCRVKLASKASFRTHMATLLWEISVSKFRKLPIPFWNWKKRTANSKLWTIPETVDGFCRKKALPWLKAQVAVVKKPWNPLGAAHK